MASTLALGPATTAVLAMLRASVALTTHVGARLYPDASGDDVPARPSYPYVHVESLSEVPLNTMGGTPNILKWGSEARLQVRVVTQSKSEAQPNAISSVIKGALDGQPITVAGYASACIEYQLIQPIVSQQAGCAVIREWVNDYLVTVHQ